MLIGFTKYYDPSWWEKVFWMHGFIDTWAARKNRITGQVQIRWQIEYIGIGWLRVTKLGRNNFKQT